MTLSTQEGTHHIPRDPTTREWRMTAEQLATLPNTIAARTVTNATIIPNSSDLTKANTTSTSTSTSTSATLHPKPTTQIRTKNRISSLPPNTLQPIKSVGFSSPIVTNIHVYSGRLRELAQGKGRRVMRLHKRLHKRYTLIDRWGHCTIQCNGGPRMAGMHPRGPVARLKRASALF